MAKTQAIKFTGTRDSRDGDEVSFGINGRIFRQRVGQTINAEPEVIDFLKDNGISFEEVAGGAGSKEGSADPAPENTPPHMLPRSVEDRGDGGNSGDVTAAGFGDGPGPEKGDTSIASAAKVADARVAAERRAAPAAINAGGVSAAELAGEGEGGTPKADAPKADAGSKSK